jgi:hypothetical protein
MSGIGTINDVINNLPAIFYHEGQHLWNHLAQQVAMSKKNKGRGPAVNWTVSNGGSNVQTRAPGYTVTPSTDVLNSDRVKLTLNRGIYSTSFGFTDDELATVESYLGQDAIADIVRDLWGDEYVNQLSALMRKIEIDSLAGNGTDPVSGQSNIVGFANFIAASGSYGGATFGGSTNPGLVASVQSSVGNVTRANIRTMFASIKQASGWNPDYIETDPQTATYLNGIGDNQIRYFNRGDREIFETTAQVLRPGSMDSVTSILGVPVVENSAWGATSTVSSPAFGVADGYVLFGARDKTHYDILTYTPAQDAFLSAMHQGLSKADNQEAMPVGLPVRSWAQAKTAASKVVTLDLSVQFVCDAPNRFGLMVGVTGFTPNT